MKDKNTSAGPCLVCAPVRSWWWHCDREQKADFIFQKLSTVQAYLGILFCGPVRQQPAARPLRRGWLPGMAARRIDDSTCSQHRVDHLLLAGRDDPKEALETEAAEEKASDVGEILGRQIRFNCFVKFHNPSSSSSSRSMMPNDAGWTPAVRNEAKQQMESFPATDRPGRAYLKKAFRTTEIVAELRKCSIPKRGLLA